ncbi:hypothetical protein GQ42DRAFT_172261, partial [Ramicandelaber brevisporus]
LQQAANDDSDVLDNTENARWVNLTNQLQDGLHQLQRNIGDTTGKLISWIEQRTQESQELRDVRKWETSCRRRLLELFKCDWSFGKVDTGLLGGVFKLTNIDMDSAGELHLRWRRRMCETFFVKAPLKSFRGNVKSASHASATSSSGCCEITTSTYRAVQLL